MKSRLLSMLLCFAVLFSSGCARPKEPLTITDFFFDTVIRILLYDTADPSVLKEAMEICQEYENKFSRTIETSEISKINNSRGSAVTVSDETIELLKKAIYYSEISNGAFDITIAPVSSLWNFKENTGTVPSENEIQEARSHVNYKNILIEGNTVTLTDPEMAIDLGSIAKGYIADQLKKFFISKGIDHGIIDLGGNVLTIGNKPDGSNFHVGIQKPFDERNETIASLSVNDKSVVSSGIYERYFKTDGKIYHHILDPSTGYPYENNLLSVTILSDSSVDGDALSTTCFSLGLSKGMELINKTKNTEAIFITKDYELHYSKNIEDIILK